MILIGSAAFDRFAPNLFGRKPKDIDFISPCEGVDVPDWVSPGTRTEVTFDPEFYAAILNKGSVLHPGNEGIVTPSFLMLYAMKLSSLKYCTETWWKHWKDVQVLQDTYGFNQAMVYANGMMQVCDAHSKRCNRNASSKDRLTFDMPDTKFFENSKNVRVIPHDTLHATLSRHVYDYRQVPLYTRFLKSEDKPFVDLTKLQRTDKKVKLDLFKEEVMVIATERFIIPSNFKMTGYEAISRAIPLMFSRLTKGEYCDMMLSLLGDEETMKSFYRSVPHWFMFPSKNNLFWQDVERFEGVTGLKHAGLVGMEYYRNLRDKWIIEKETIQVGPFEMTSLVYNQEENQLQPLRVYMVEDLEGGRGRGANYLVQKRIKEVFSFG